MTFVGKILVIVIMVFALFFLAVSTVVFSTATNWKEEATKRKTEISKLNTEVSKYKAEVDAQKNALVETKKQADQQIGLLGKEVKDAQEQTNLRQKEITDQRTEVEKAVRTKVCACSSTTAISRDHMICMWICDKAVFGRDSIRKS